MALAAGGSAGRGLAGFVAGILAPGLPDYPEPEHFLRRLARCATSSSTMGIIYLAQLGLFSLV